MHKIPIFKVKQIKKDSPSHPSFLLTFLSENEILSMFIRCFCAWASDEKISPNQLNFMISFFFSRLPYMKIFRLEGHSVLHFLKNISTVEPLKVGICI